MTHVVNPKVVQRLCNLNLLWEIEEGIGKLLALSQRALDDLKSRDVAQEISGILVRIRAMRMRVVSGLNGGESWVGYKWKSISVISSEER